MKIPRTFFDRIEQLFPHPIAYSLSIIRQSATIGDKCNNYIFLFEIIARYCSLLVLGDYLSHKKRDKNIDRMVINFLQAESNLASWVKFLKEILHFYINKRDELFIPELFSFILDTKGAVTDNYECFEQVINISNKCSKVESPEEYPIYLEKLEVLSIEILEELTFLQKYPLIETVAIKSQGNRFTTTVHTCMGSDSEFIPENVSSSKPFNPGRVQIVDNEGFLSFELYPLVISHKCSLCNKNHIFLFDCVLNNKMRFFSPVDNQEIELTTTNNTLRQLVTGNLEPRRRVDYIDIWKDIRTTREKDFACKYKLLELIGCGGMGEVYKAYQANIGAIRAIKILPRNLSTNAKCIKRFEREAKLSARVENENIVRIIDVGSYDEERYMVMEFIQGKTLRDILNEEGSLPENRIIEIAISIASGLSWIHQNDIIHRDIKPENIMIDINNRVKLMDFGISRAMDSTRFTAVGMPIGTAQYFSPEQAGAASEIGFASDIYSLGIVFYEMITGNFPYIFKDDNLIGIAYTILNTPPAPLSDISQEISPELEKIVMKCLEKDPDDRYNDANKLLTDLKSLGWKDSHKLQEINNIDTKRALEDAFKVFLEGLFLKGDYVDDGRKLIEERRISLNISHEDARMLEREVKSSISNKLYKTRKAGPRFLSQQKYLQKKPSKAPEIFRIKKDLSRDKKEQEKIEIASREHNRELAAIEEGAGKYKKFLEEVWNKEYQTDEELKALEDKKIELCLPEDIVMKIEKEVDTKLRDREKAKLELLDIGLTNYRALLKNLWSKGYLTEDDRKYLTMQKETYDLPASILGQLEKDFEDLASIKKSKMEVKSYVITKGN